MGIGLRSGTSSADVLAAIRAAVGDRSVRCIGTVDRRAEEPGLSAAAAELDVPLVGFSAEELAEIDVPNPSDRIAAVVGTPSVAEAAAILAADGGGLVIAKTSSSGITVAAAQPSSTPAVP